MTQAPPIVPEIKMLSLTHFDEVYGVHCQVVNTLEDPDHLRPLSAEFMRRQFDAGIVYGVFDQEKMIGYAILELRHEEDAYQENFLPVDVHHVAQLAGTGVNTAYRGMKIQQRLIEHRMSQGRTLGFEHFYATASPKNIICRANLMKAGFYVVDRRIMYGNLDRHLLYRPVHEPQFEEEARLVQHADFDAQEALLRAGFWGTTMDATGISFSRPRSLG